jgi:nitrite reductase/ring-hydroxylating ferredoxin subunit/uncharacterized membrane protein
VWVTDRVRRVRGVVPVWVPRRRASLPGAARGVNRPTDPEASVGVPEVLDELLDRLERARGLDAASKAVVGVVDPATRPRPIKKALSGTWLGHRLHPALVTVPIGAWVGALVLDLSGDEDTQQAADAMIGLGIVAAAPTALAGLSDWVDSEPSVRRVGLVHAATNTLALACYAGSLALRRRGARRAALGWSLLGLGTVAAGAWLGGHLTYVQGMGVDRRAFQPDPPKEWTTVLADAELPERAPRRVRAGEAEVMVVRLDGRVHALAAACVHLGGPLEEGSLEGDCVVCPWHGSTFRLEDGAVVAAPASGPQPAYPVRVHDGMIQVRAASGEA